MKKAIESSNFEKNWNLVKDMSEFIRHSLGVHSQGLLTMQKIVQKLDNDRKSGKFGAYKPLFSDIAMNFRDRIPHFANSPLLEFWSDVTLPDYALFSITDINKIFKDKNILQDKIFKQLKGSLKEFDELQEQVCKDLF